jgi:DNA-binding CsgD family transcriptional regulator
MYYDSHYVIGEIAKMLDLNMKTVDTFCTRIQDKIKSAP